MGGLTGELDGHFEFGEHIALHVQGQLGAIIFHDRAQMIRAQVDFGGQAELCRCDAVRAGLRCLLKDLVAARVLELESERPARSGLMVGAVQSERAHVDGLAGLVERLLRGEQDRRLIFDSHLLGDFGGTERRVGDVVECVTAGHGRGESEARVRGPSAIDGACEDGATIEFHAHRPRAGDGFVLGVSHNHTDGGRASRQIGLLSKNADHGHAQNLGNRLGVFERRAIAVCICEAVAQALPHKVVDGEWFGDVQILLPGAGGFDSSFRMSEHDVGGIEYVDGQSAWAGMGRGAGDAYVQSAARVSGGKRFAISRTSLEGFHNSYEKGKRKNQHEPAIHSKAPDRVL